MDTTRPSLLRRIRDRADTEAWQAFDTLYRPLLYRFACANGLDHGDAEDITQQCLAAISDHIGEFDYDPRKGRFKAWLRTLVNNRVRNLLRDRKEHSAHSRDFHRAQQREPSPEAAFDKIWMEEHLRHCLCELRHEIGETTFRAFELYVIEQRAIEEVCDELNLTSNNVYTIKWRMTQKVAEKMNELLGEGED